MAMMKNGLESFCIHFDEVSRRPSFDSDANENGSSS
jgi:hypothetical protein